MVQENDSSRLVEGSRDTRNWYLEQDPLALVDRSLINYIHAHAGQEILDLGCGTGGYSRVLADLGHAVKALDIHAEYVELARRLGVDANPYDGQRIPLPDASVDTVIMVEVLEHVPQPEGLLRELARVTRGNVIITVPNCSQRFRAPVVLNHMLDVDHKIFYTTDSLQTLLSGAFAKVQVNQVGAVDLALAQDILPRWAFRIYRAAIKRGVLRPRFYFRLIANATNLSSK